jgi:hypothetical protein
MGDGRSLKGLRDQLAEDGVDPPAYSTLRTWSSAGQWRQRAAEHDSGVVVTVEHIMEQKAATRVELSELAEKAAAVGFVALAEILAKWRPTEGEDIERMAAITAALADSSSALKQDGLRGALPILEGPFAAAQLAGDGGGIFELVKDHFLPPPEGA